MMEKRLSNEEFGELLDKSGVPVQANHYLLAQFISRGRELEALRDRVRVLEVDNASLRKRVNPIERAIAEGWRLTAPQTGGSEMCETVRNEEPIPVESGDGTSTAASRDDSA